MFSIFNHFRKALALLAVMAVPVAAFAVPAGATSSSPTIAETAIAVSGSDGFDDNAGDFDLLIQALTAADLVDAVNDPSADLTVFAPTDQAFVRLARDLGFIQPGYDEEAAFGFIVEQLTALGSGDPIPVLTDVLLFHVSPGTTLFESLRGQSVEVPTLLGTSFTANGRHLVDAAPGIEDPRIQNPLTDIEASNGVIHGISRVLLPVALEQAPPPAPDPSLPTIAETAIAVSSSDGFDSDNGDFDLLIQALTAAGLVDAVNDPSADLTVFAPTDQGFLRLARDLGFSEPGYNEEAAFGFIVDQLTVLGDGDPIPLLTDILLFHVSPGRTFFSELRGQTVEVPTLQGTTITATDRFLADAAPSLEDPRIKTPLTDIQASNGVIHGLNRVLIPLNI